MKEPAERWEWLCRWLFPLWRARAHHTLLPRPYTFGHLTPAAVKLGPGCIAGKCLPFLAARPLCMDLVCIWVDWVPGAECMDCELDSVQCRALVDTGSTVSLIRLGFLHAVDIVYSTAMASNTWWITTTTGEWVNM